MILRIVSARRVSGEAGHPDGLRDGGGGDVLAERFLDLRRRHLRVFEDVVQQAGDERRPVEVHVGQHVSDLEGVAEVGFSGTPDLALVGPGRENVVIAHES